MDVFIHIPKSAGSTIRAILSREYGVNSILYFEPDSGEWKKHAPSVTEFLHQQMSQQQIRLITGHDRFGIHARIKAACRYFSIVRDPIDRAISDYFYAFTFADHRFRDEIVSRKVSLDEYITSGKYAYGSEQTDMLAGNWPFREGKVQAAIETIRNSFVIVGTAERFDESILLMAKLMGWKPPLFVRKNVTRLDPQMQAERAKSQVMAHSSYEQYFKADYEVYHATNEWLSHLIEEEGMMFQQALEAFREIENEIAARADELVFDLYELRENDKLPDFASRFIDSEPYRVIANYFGARSPTSHVISAKNYVGQVDVMKGRIIEGWAGDLSRPVPIDVTVWRAGERVAKISCDLVRDDLMQDGFVFGQMGFRRELQHPIVRPEDYKVCFEETSICVHSPNTRKTLQ